MLKPTFELDHIIEIANGGEDTIENIQALCVECHAFKTHNFRLKKIQKTEHKSCVFSDDKPVFSKYFYKR